MAMAVFSIKAMFRSARPSGSATLRTGIPTQLRPRLTWQGRPLSATSRSAYPRKDSQDRESINTDATEYSKSGSDDSSAAQERAAFEPGRTDPEEAKQEAGKDVRRFHGLYGNLFV